MPTDIKLDEGDGNWLVLEGAVVKTTASDLVIDSPGRRSSPSGHRRAFVHDQRDGLTINFNAEEVEHGDDMGLVSPSAERLGFRIQYADRHGRHLQGIPPDDPEFMFRDVLSLRPEAGTMLRRGSEVVVRVDYDG